jgi:hypothetical protein
MVVTVPVYSLFQYFYSMYLSTAKTFSKIGTSSGQKAMMILNSKIRNKLDEMTLRSVSHLSRALLW